MKPLEAKVQSDIVKYLKAQGVYVYRAMGNAMTGKGTPDVLCCINGRFVAMEFKREHNGAYGVTPAQEIRMRQIRKAGGEAYVVTTVSEAADIVYGEHDER